MAAAFPEDDISDTVRPEVDMFVTAIHGTMKWEEFTEDEKSQFCLILLMFLKHHNFKERMRPIVKIVVPKKSLKDMDDPTFKFNPEWMSDEKLQKLRKKFKEVNLTGQDWGILSNALLKREKNPKIFKSPLKPNKEALLLGQLTLNPNPKPSWERRAERKQAARRVRRASGKSSDPNSVVSMFPVYEEQEEEPVRYDKGGEASLEAEAELCLFNLYVTMIHITYELLMIEMDSRDEASESSRDDSFSEKEDPATPESPVNFQEYGGATGTSGLGIGGATGTSGLGIGGATGTSGFGIGGATGTSGFGIGGATGTSGFGIGGATGTSGFGIGGATGTSGFGIGGATGTSGFGIGGATGTSGFGIGGATGTSGFGIGGATGTSGFGIGGATGTSGFGIGGATGTSGFGIGGATGTSGFGIGGATGTSGFGIGGATGTSGFGIGGATGTSGFGIGGATGTSGFGIGGATGTSGFGIGGATGTSGFGIGGATGTSGYGIGGETGTSSDGINTSLEKTEILFHDTEQMQSENKTDLKEACRYGFNKNPIETPYGSSHSPAETSLRTSQSPEASPFVAAHCSFDKSQTSFHELSQNPLDTSKTFHYGSNLSSTDAEFEAGHSLYDNPETLSYAVKAKQPKGKRRFHAMFNQIALFSDWRETFILPGALNRDTFRKISQYDKKISRERFSSMLDYLSRDGLCYFDIVLNDQIMKFSTGDFFLDPRLMRDDWRLADEELSMQFGDIRLGDAEYSAFIKICLYLHTKLLQNKDGLVPEYLVELWLKLPDPFQSTFIVDDNVGVLYEEITFLAKWELLVLKYFTAMVEKNKLEPEKLTQNVHLKELRELMDEQGEKPITPAHLLMNYQHLHSTADFLINMGAIQLSQEATAKEKAKMKKGKPKKRGGKR